MLADRTPNVRGQDTSALSDVDLLERWGKGNNAAGEELYRRHVDKVRGFFRRRVPDSAEDCVQNAFLACFEARDRFRGDAKFTTFLYAVCRNLLLSHLRKHRAPAAALDPRKVPDEQPSVLSLIGRVEDERRVTSALNVLPGDYQRALELFYWDELPAPEIAEQLGVPEGTIRSRLRRGRLRMRPVLEAA